MATGSPPADAAVILDLHADLYPLAAIEAAVAAFAPFGELTLERSGAYHRVTLRPRAGDPGDELGRKFANYVLGVIGVTDPSS